MWPLLIVASVMGVMRPASEVWDVLHGTLRWVSEADGPCEAGLCDLRGHRGRGLTEGLSEASGGGGVRASEASLPPEASQVAAEGEYPIKLPIVLRFIFTTLTWSVRIPDVCNSWPIF